MSVERLRASLADRYTIERELGAGGMATVYLAHDIKHDRNVAIKVLHPDLGAALGGERFLTEIKTTARLQHPHILPLLDSGNADGLLYYVMPVVTGESLRARLTRERQLPIEDVLRIAGEMGDALDAAHALGIIHRDIKPENILLQGGHALVADFGIALAVQTAGGERMTQTGLSLGTPQYMSPEQAMGERTIDARSDVYALGAVTYEMLTGDPPFAGSSVQAIVAKVLTEKPTAPSRIRDTVSQGMEDAVLKALAKLPADRFATASEFSQALRRDGSGAQRPATSPRRRTSSRFPRPAFGAIFILLAAAAAWGWLRPTGSSPAPRVFDAALPDSALMSSTPDVGSTGFGTSVLNLAVAANGDFVVYPVRHGDSTSLWYRSLVDASAHPIAGTAGATMPRISPDGSRLAFTSGNGIVVMPLAGGDAKRLLQADAPPTTLEWVSPTRLLTIDGEGTGLHWLDAEVGASEAPGMTAALKARCYFGRWVASQQRLLCAQGEGVFEEIKTGTTRAIRARNADGTSGSTVVTGQEFQIVDDRYVVYLGVDGDMRAAPYDRRTDLIGRSVSLLSGIKADAAGAGQMGLTPNGTLVFAPGTATSDVRMVVLHPGKEPQPLAIERAHFLRFDLTRDGHRLAAVVITPQGHELRIYDLRTGQRQTWLRAEYIGGPFWDAAGERLVVRTWNGTRAAILRGSPDAATPPDTVISAATLGQLPEPTDFHDETSLLARGGASPYAVIRFDLTRQPARVDTLMTDAIFTAISPDGKSLVWQAQGSGQLSITSYPPVSRRHIVAEAAVEPLWLSSTELLYRTGITWNVAHVNPATGDLIGTPTRWGADSRFLDTPGWSNRVSWDGGIIYVQSADVSDTRFLRIIPDFVSRMKAAVDKANR